MYWRGRECFFIGVGLVRWGIGLGGVVGGGGGCSCRGIVCFCGGGFVICRRFFVAREGDVGGGFEELFPELGGVRLGRLWKGGGGYYFGAFPDILGVLCILLHNRQDTRRHNTVGSTEVVIDF